MGQLRPFVTGVEVSVTRQELPLAYCVNRSPYVVSREVLFQGYCPRCGSTA